LLLHRQLANAVAAQAAQQGFDAAFSFPPDLEPAKVLNTAVYGARIVRINGNYDHVIVSARRSPTVFSGGLVNVNLRPYYSEGSKDPRLRNRRTTGWTLPDHVVVPMAGGSLITKIAKSIPRTRHARLGGSKARKILRRAATGCSPISDGVKRNLSLASTAEKPNTIARSLAIGNPADGPLAIKQIRDSGGWAEDISDPEIVAASSSSPNGRHFHRKTAGGVTVASPKN